MADTSPTVINVDTGWIALSIFVSALLLADECRCERTCAEWKDGGPLDPVSAQERRERAEYCATHEPPPTDEQVRAALRAITFSPGPEAE